MIRSLLVLAFVLSAASVQAKPVCGDVDGDGYLTVDDASLLNLYLAGVASALQGCPSGTSIPGGQPPICGDTNGNRLVNLADVGRINLWLTTRDPALLSKCPAGTERP